CFISNMGPTEGDYVVVIALTEPDKGVKGMSAIVVDRGTPGFTVGKREEKMGIRGADISELIFEDCRVPRSNLVGKEGEGFKIAMMALDGGRIGMAAQALGICEAAIAASVKYMGERVQFGKPIGKNQGLQWYLADMATRTEAAKALILEAAVAADNGQPLSKLAAMCKYYASENAVWVTNKALQIHGGYGYMRDYPIERMYRDARIVPIYEGTSEVQKMVIAREVMK
ncbi:acyl-CoA dehydrogenase family protein, partial [Intestinimonas massiliensis]